MPYTITRDGKIARVLHCKPERLAANLQPGEDYFEGEFHPAAYELDRSGKPTPKKTAKTQKAAVHPPTEKHLFKALLRDLKAAGIPTPTVDRLLEQNGS